jgi:hypothetical protein
MDELLEFSSVCDGADVIVITDKPSCGCSILPSNGQRPWDALLGIRRTVEFSMSSDRNHPDVDYMKIERELRALGPYDCVYTHSPMDRDPLRSNINLAVSKLFKRVRVPALGSIASEVTALSIERFRQKWEAVNRHFVRNSQGIACWLSGASITSVETFVEISYEDAVRAAALSRGDILASPHVADCPDLWGFERSTYEAGRIEATCRLLLDSVVPETISHIIEVGACEGQMTRRLRYAFPKAKISAIEPYPPFASRLKTKFCKDTAVNVVQATISDIALLADIILIAEMLYYMTPESIHTCLEKLKAKYLLTSCGLADGQVCYELQSRQWKELAQETILPKYEPVDGEDSALISLRAGTTVRVWQAHCA